MPSYTGDPNKTINLTTDELTTQSPGHPNTFNPKFRQMLDNDAVLDKRINDHKNASVLDHPDGSVTDAKIGNRTADPAQAPTSNGPGTLTQWFSWITNRIKAILGGTLNWWDAPPTTLTAAKAHIDDTVKHITDAERSDWNAKETPAGAQAKVDAHASRTDNPHAVTKAQVGLGNVQNYGIATQAQAEAGSSNNVYMTPLRTKQSIDKNLADHLTDYVRQPGYGTASGSNAKTITLSPAPTAYVDGMAISFKNATQNTGAVTLNVNGLGAKNVLNSKGEKLKAGDLKANSIYTVRYNGANFILQGEGGDFSVGDTITDVRLLRLSGGMGAEIWSKTDVSYGHGVAVDSTGNVYCSHNVSSGKVIRKLNSSGNEVWSKTDVGHGRSVAVDSAGHVYCTHYLSSGNKTIRKLDSSSNEVWSKTDVANGYGVAVDSAGNVYCAHNVSSGKAIRKLNSSGNEVWSKTDVANGLSVAVDSAGNVYCAHNVSSGGKAIRKLDSSGNEVWSKTDVANGLSVAVDSAGNVYCAHNVSSGGKVIRKLNSSGNEVWSKTDVANGMSVAVDSAGNVYCAHYIESGKAIRKLDNLGNEIWSKTDIWSGQDVAVDSAGYVYCAHYVVSSKSIRKLDGNKYFQIV